MLGPFVAREVEEKHKWGGGGIEAWGNVEGEKVERKIKKK